MHLPKLLTYVDKVHIESTCPLHERILRSLSKSEPVVQVQILHDMLAPRAKGNKNKEDNSATPQGHCTELTFSIQYFFLSGYGSFLEGNLEW